MIKKRSKKTKELSRLPMPPVQERAMKKPLLILTVIFALVALLLALLITMTFLMTEKPWEKLEKNITEKIEVKPFEFVPKQPLSNATQAVLYLPAVNDKGEGVMTALVVEAMQGTGRTLVDIDNLLFWADTQHSIRIAKKVAANFSNISTDNFDLVYSIYANATAIGGESAGAAITIGTIAVLLNKTVRKDVVITGTINHDGTIGPVQAVLQKAKAAKAVNATIFLVPLLQSQEVIYEERKHCEKFGPSEVCTIERIPKKISISEEANITVKEVETIEEALKYFLIKNI